MENKRSTGGSFTNPGGQPAGAFSREISYCAISELTPHPSNMRKHSPSQIRAIAKSIAAFGFNAPILADRSLQILAGHGRCEGAKSLGMTHAPVVFSTISPKHKPRPTC